MTSVRYVSYTQFSERLDACVQAQIFDTIHPSATSFWCRYISREWLPVGVWAETQTIETYVQLQYPDSGVL